MPETLSQEVLDMLQAPPKPAYPVIQPDDLVKFDAFILGIPTRFGNYPYQWKVRMNISYKWRYALPMLIHDPLVCICALYSRSGMQQERCGLKASSLANTLPSLFLREAKAADRKLPCHLPSLPSPITVFSTFHSVIAGRSLS